MKIRSVAAALILVLLGSSAGFAQFPPPGIYQCIGPQNTPLGTLLLLTAGEYQFSVAADKTFKEKPGDPGNGKGQLASAGSSITAQSGPLATVYHWKGSFKVDRANHRVSFIFTGADAKPVMCRR